MIDRRMSKPSFTGIVYQYPDGSQDLIAASAPIFHPPGWEIADDWGAARPAPSPREAGVKSEGEDMERSMRRARARLRRLALSNKLDYFVTLTLDGSKIDRYDGAAITRKLNQWCSNMVKRHGLRYILVPELHQDGALHFHGFMGGDGLRVVDSGIRWENRPVYNLPQWSYGFTTAQQLYGEYSAAVAYCCKYIGKQQGQRPLGRWYYSGGDLREPVKVFADLDFQELEGGAEFDIPGAKIRIQNNLGGKSCENRRIHEG